LEAERARVECAARLVKRKVRIRKVTVKLRPGESQESLLKRFRNEVTKGRVLSDVRKKRWFVSKSEQRRIAKRKGIRRAKKRQRQRTKER
jgi:small subunit ribosomal protein S21